MQTMCLIEIEIPFQRKLEVGEAVWEAEIETVESWGMMEMR